MLHNGRAEHLTKRTARNATNANPKTYFELGSGLNYWTGSEWAESRETIELLADGAIARHGQHKVLFSPDITQGTELFTADGKRLRSRILGIVIVDTETGARELTAPLREAPGEIHGNQVIYANAFENLRADVRLTYRTSGFEQDVIFREQPQIEARGLTAARTRIEVWTEFFSPDQPKIDTAIVYLEKNAITRQGVAEPDVTDDSLDFGAMLITEGSAFPVSESPFLGDNKTVRVSKAWVQNPEGRTFLVESISYTELEPLLKALPVAVVDVGKAGAKFWEGFVSIGRQANMANFAAGLFNNRASLTRKGVLQVAARQPHADPGVVIDYLIVNTITNFTFQPDTTYYIKSPVFLSGNIQINGNTIVKYTNSWGGMTLTFLGPVDCNTSVGSPAYFTAKDDDTVGETIIGSTGVPTSYYGDAYLNLGFSAHIAVLNLRHLILRHAHTGFHMPQGREVTLDNVQISDSDTGLFNKEIFKLRNVLFYKTVRVFAGQFTTAVTTAEHLTLHNCTHFIYGTTLPNILLTNSLLIGVTNRVLWTGANVETNLSDSGIFTTVRAGGHYLPTSSPYRGVGTTNLSSNVLASIRSRTVTAPTILTNLVDGQVLAPTVPFGTGIPSLGYHYPVLDYIIRTAAVANATVLFTNGVSIGIDTVNTNFGIFLGENAHVISQGTPLTPNRLVRLHSVQEGRLTNTLGSATIAVLPTNAPTSTLRLNFTELPLPAGDFYHLKDAYTLGSLSNLTVRNSQLNGGTWKYSSQSADQLCAFTNNLLDCVSLELRPATASTAHLRNNTFRLGNATLDTAAGSVLHWYDNIFDGTTISQSGAGTVSHNFNGYVTNGTRLTPTAANDVVLTNLSVVYASNTLGRFYLPATSRFVDAGSTNASAVGLYHFTTRTNHVKEASGTNDLGFHYIAVANGAPVDTDAEGLPDYFEDLDGDGISDSGETDWTLRDTDGDGVDDYLEFSLGGNPLTTPSNDTNGLINLRVFTPLK